MHKIILSGLIGLLFSGIYDFQVPKIEGGTQALSTFSGKRLLIVTLPINQNAVSDSFLYSLDTIATAHAATHKIIAVPAYEDGYSLSQKDSLKQWYRSKLSTGILITDGLYTRKTSGSQQHPVFKWLTHNTENGIFDVDINNAGYKFFLLPDGKLYGVLKPGFKIWGNAVFNTLTVEE